MQDRENEMLKQVKCFVWRVNVYQNLKTSQNRLTLSGSVFLLITSTAVIYIPDITAGTMQTVMIVIFVETI